MFVVVHTLRTSHAPISVLIDRALHCGLHACMASSYLQAKSQDRSPCMSTNIARPRVWRRYNTCKLACSGPLRRSCAYMLTMHGGVFSFTPVTSHRLHCCVRSAVCTYTCVYTCTCTPVYVYTCVCVYVLGILCTMCSTATFEPM